MAKFWILKMESNCQKWIKRKDKNLSLDIITELVLRANRLGLEGVSITNVRMDETFAGLEIHVETVTK